MATSSAMSTSNDKIKYKITVTQNSQNVTNNTSNVTVSVRFYRTNTGYTSYGSGTVYCKINGTQYSEAVTKDDKITSSGIVLFSKTLNITHNADGTKTLATSAWIKHDVVTSSEQSYSQALTTIPRATTPTLSVSSADMGTSVTVNMPRASSSFDHTLTYSFGSATGTIGTDLGTSKAWTIPLTLANQIPNATSGTCTITCKTYNGSTLIGTKSVSLTIKVPSSVVPSISSVTATEAVSGLNAKFNAFIQNKSKITANITAGGAYSSTIKTYQTTINGISYSGSTITSGIIKTYGNLTISATVTDSRGRKATKTATVSVLPYTAPKITTFSVFRSDSTGAQEYEGEMATANINFEISSVNNLNDKSYVVEYKKKTDSAWSQLGSGSVYSMNTKVTFDTVLSIDVTYDVRLVVKDYFGSATAIGELPTAFTLIDLHSGGRGIAFGKVSELEDTMEIALPMKSTHGHLINSPVLIPQGTDLDDLKSAGYFVFSSGTSTTLVNSPLGGSGSGSIEIVKEGDSTQVRQIITRCSELYREVWERVYYSNTWKQWMRVFNGIGRILWTGGMYMTAGHTATLSEPISDQSTGIVIVFSRYSDGTVQDTNFSHFFIPKAFVNAKNGYGHTFIMASNKFSVVATKYLYVNNDRIVGHADSNATGTANGITYNNAGFVMRYVIGV